METIASKIRRLERSFGRMSAETADKDIKLDRELPENPTMDDIRKALRELVDKGAEWAKKALDVIDKEVERAKNCAEMDRRMGLTPRRPRSITEMNPDEIRALRRARAH